MGRAVLGSKYRTQSYPTYPMAPAVKGGRINPGTEATRYRESSSSRIGRGSASGPWPEPVLMVFLGSGGKVVSQDKQGCVIG